MKYLFVLNHANYLRNYGEVIAELARRGHDITLAFSAPRAGDPDVVAEAFGASPQIAVVDLPAPTGWWWAAADPIRALRDYAHYLAPAFDDAPRLVARASDRVPAIGRTIMGGRGASPKRRARNDRMLDGIERSIPPDPGIMDWLQPLSPDAVLVTPLIDFTYDQLHVLKAARALAIPTGHLVASWDNLTNKGRIQIAADICVVWNEDQRGEALRLHALPSDRIVVTGAQLYDRWFGAVPSTTRATFCAGLGFEPGRPILLYACSSPFICADEVTIVRDWLRRLRASADPILRSAQIIVRPHPIHTAQWAGVDLGEFGPVVISEGSEPAMVKPEERETFADTLHHAGAVVGINTSVFLEAAIFGRRCLAVPTEGVGPSQLGTLHFRHLVAGGVVELATGWGDYFAWLGQALRDEPADRTRANAFIASFLRPNGIDRPVMPMVADAIERLADFEPLPDRPPAGATIIRALLAPVAAAYLRPRYFARRARRPPAGGRP